MALTFVTPAPYSSFLTNSSCLCLFSFIVALLCRLWCLYALVLVISLIHLGNLLVLPSLLFSPFELAPLSRQCVSLLKGKRLSRYARQPTARHETLNTTRFETRLLGPTTLLTYSPWQTVANWNTRSSPDLKQETGTGGSNEPNCKEKPKPTKTFNIKSFYQLVVRWYAIYSLAPNMWTLFHDSILSQWMLEKKTLQLISRWLATLNLWCWFENTPYS